LRARITFVEETHRGEHVVRVSVLADDSSKQLTKSRAAKLLARAYPELKVAGKVSLIDAKQGWLAVTAIEPRRNVWLRVYVAPLSN
jgi:hypothetical protein